MVRRERWLLSRDGRHSDLRVNLVAAHSSNAGRFAYLAVAGLIPIKSLVRRGYCSVASDQHQPASSRAMATLATT